MMPAPDAIVIDTSELNAEAVCARVVVEVKKVFRLT
jgi:cytidylate kinase